MNSQQIIGIIKEEYLRRQTRKRVTASKAAQSETNQVIICKPKRKRATLASHISSKKPQQADAQARDAANISCKLCKRNNHKTEDCCYLGQPKCDTCGQFGHHKSECRSTNSKPEN